MSTRTIIVAAALTLVTGAGIGHALMPSDLATIAESSSWPTATTVAPAPSWHVVTRDEAFASYTEVYGENNSCRADFDASYQGTRFVADLPAALQAEVKDQLQDGYLPMADYLDGSVIGVIGQPDQVVIVGAYSGRC